MEENFRTDCFPRSVGSSRLKPATLLGITLRKMIERSNRGVKDALATFVGEHPDYWDNMLPFVRLAVSILCGAQERRSTAVISADG